MGNAGPEIGVASTKAYTSQILSLTMFALVMSADRMSFQARRNELIDALNQLPELIKEVLKQDEQILTISKELHQQKSLLIMMRDPVYSKCMNALQQIVARDGRPIIICETGDTETAGWAKGKVIEVPRTVDALQSILTVIPMQLLSYHLAVLRGCNVDCPRNLAKSVTVE